MQKMVLSMGIAMVQQDSMIAKCHADMEILIESEVSQRFLEKMNHITYGVLKKDQPACNSGKSGKAYSKSCLPKESNPDSRGCSEYYKCRQGSRSPVTLFT
ncbi:Protein RALF-like 32 [Camellia lanceoleosa]|uniref:Protein RALF-like 32 n=1 Tax=Camellia lanceoleosa TaxID=1840588 RepID=A0ACC0IJ49_9ERIC|nr:Protein RALF-like 32 [Camellia lanceoleosa]